MNRNTQNHRNLHGKMLAGAIVAALSIGASGTAAADSAYTYDGAQTLTLQNYLQAIANQQVLNAPVSASVVDGAVGYRGPAADGALTVSGNTIEALTLNASTSLLGANGASNSIDLGLLGVQDDGLPLGDVNQGIGILNGQLATAGVTTAVTNGNIGLDLTDYTAGNGTVTGNTLNATTLVNGVSNRATGDLNTTPFSSTTAGGVSADYTPAGANIGAVGGVTIANAQMAADVVSSAVITDSDISMVNTGTSSTAPMDVAGNTVSASDTGNRGDNRFSATAGAVSYTGAVGVVNGQANLGGSTTASVSGTDIGAQDVESAGAYAGAMNVSGNTMGANAQGNDAAAVDANGNLVRGNVISFGQGIDVTGTGTGATVGLMFADDQVYGNAAADLALLNSQGNQDNTITGSVDGSRIGGEVTILDGGSMTASDNRVSAGAGGNSAINLVSANGASFAASVAAGNQQTNDHTDISASASDVVVGTEVAGNANLADVTVGNSRIGANANGSSAKTVVDLQGSNFAAAGAGAVAANGSNAGFTSLDTGTAGIVAGNLQANYGAGNTIRADASGAILGALFGTDVNASDVSVGSSAIAASAGGNSASTSIAVGGATGALTASLGSGQYNAHAVTASANGDFLGIQSATGDFVGSKLTVGDSSLSTKASANQSSNSLTTDFDSSLTLAGGGAGSVINASASTNNTNAALIVLNDQINDGADVSATTSGGQIGVVGGSMVNGSAVSVQGNSAAASAIGNSTGNQLAVGAGSLERDAGGSGTLAALGNLQQMSGDSAAAIGGFGIGFASSGTAVDMTGTVSGNSLSAFAGGNMAGGDGGAGNTLSASGTSLVDSGTAIGTAVHDASEQSAQASFTLQNAQSSTLGERSATIANASIGGSADGSAVNSSLSVSGNGMSADARDNYAMNSLGLDFDSALTTTAMLQSVQSSNGSMVGSVTGAEIGLTATAIIGSSLTVTGNDVSAKAVANTASNQLLVKATQLAGNAGDLPGEVGYRGAAVNSGVDYVVADYGLSNVQARSGDSIAVSADTIQVGISTDTGGLIGGTATVSDNAVTVLGQGNSAGNGLALSGSGIDASAAIFNAQTMSSDVTASAEDVHVNVNVANGVPAGTPVTVSGNSVGVYAGLNDAVNALSVNAANAVSGSVGLAGASNDPTSFNGFTGAAADFAVSNLQDSDSDSAANAILTDVRAGILVGDGGVHGAGGSLTVTGNQFEAKASGNTASNSVALNGAGNVGATAAVNSQQSNGGAIGSVVTGADVTAGNSFGSMGDIDGSPMTVADNRVTGTASGNSASNAINVSSAVLNGAGFVGTGSGSDNVSSTAIADYALNNVQGNGGAVNSTMSNVNIGGNLAGGVGAVLNSHGTIGSNMVVASASGNSASNSITLASVAGMPSAALTNSQVNTASVTASITGARIGMLASGLGITSVTVTNNTISATATGNSAVNQIGLGR